MGREGHGGIGADAEGVGGATGPHLEPAVGHDADHRDDDSSNVPQELKRVGAHGVENEAEDEDEACLGVPHHLVRDGGRFPDKPEGTEVYGDGEDAGESDEGDLGQGKLVVLHWVVAGAVDEEGEHTGEGALRGRGRVRAPAL